MRWDNLFDDLEGQLEQELGAEETDLRAEEERLRLGRLALRDRLVALRAAEDRPDGWSVRATLVNGTMLSIRPHTFGRDWVSGDVVSDSPRPPQFIMPLAALANLAFSRDQVRSSLDQAGDIEPERGLSRRLGLAFVLRDLCRRRRSVELLLCNGTLAGTIDRVGRDHFDIAVHEPGSARRDNAVSQYCLVPFSQVLLVRV